MPFSTLVGNQSVISTAKNEVPAAKVTIVVGKIAGGRTTFVKALEQHFAKTFRFEYYDNDEGVEALRNKICNADERKPGAMEHWIAQQTYQQDKVVRGLKVVLDDFDPTERGVCAMLESVAWSMRDRNGIIIVTDAAGIRKLSSLKRKGALVLALSCPGKDAVLRWARKTLLPQCPDEEDHDKLKAMCKACEYSIARLTIAYASAATPETAAMDSPDKVGEDNVTLLHQLFCKGASVHELLRMVEGDGGTMLGQLVVHNAPITGMDEDAYTAALELSLVGMVQERAGHVRHDKDTYSIGHMLSIAPFMKCAERYDKSSFTYTSSVAQGGARAAARRAMSKGEAYIMEDASVAEKALYETVI